MSEQKQLMAGCVLVFGQHATRESVYSVATVAKEYYSSRRSPVATSAFGTGPALM